MLTDYHTHLRPDDGDATPARFFTESNVIRYLDVAAARGIGELGFSEHVYRFREALDIWRHPFWVENAVDELDAYCDFVMEMKAAGHPVKLGLEVDYVPGREDQIARLVDGRPWDYLIGSVHFVAGGAVDHEGYDAWRKDRPEDVWSDYFRTLGAAAASGLFDIIGHLDLVKIWGRARPLPEGDPRSFYDLAIDQIARSGVAVEVSTAGLRKPVREIYPSRDLLEMCVSAACPLVLSSDAHEPEQLGYEYGTAIAMLRDAGVERISVFSGRSRSEEPLG